MFHRITTFTTRFPKSVIAFWLLLALALSSVSAAAGYKVMTDDTAEFLPKGSESAQAIAYARTAFDVQKGTRTVTMLVKRDDGKALTDPDREHVGALAATMPKWPSDSARAGRVVAAQAGPLAPDRQFQLVALQWKANATDPIAQEHFREIRDRAAAQAGAHDLTVGFTGGIATQADRVEATKDSAGPPRLLLFAAAIVLTALFFRGTLAASSRWSHLLVVGAASGLVVLAAAALGFKLDTRTPQLITVVLVGIGVDYFLFLLFRLRERLRAGEDAAPPRAPPPARSARSSPRPHSPSSPRSPRWRSPTSASSGCSARRSPSPSRDAARRRDADARDRGSHRPRACSGPRGVGARAHRWAGRPPRAPHRPSARPRRARRDRGPGRARDVRRRHDDVLRPRRRPDDPCDPHRDQITARPVRRGHRSAAGLRQVHRARADRRAAQAAARRARRRRRRDRGRRAGHDAGSPRRPDRRGARLRADQRDGAWTSPAGRSATPRTTPRPAGRGRWSPARRRRSPM